MEPTPVGAPDFTVLVVCTGNICRSALAERLASAFLDEVLGVEADSIQVVSAGTHAVVGSGVHPDSATVLAGLGGDPAGFAARQLQDDMAVEADLTLTMTRDHRRSVLKRSPRALQKTFTLREAAELVGLVDDAPGHAEDDPADRLRGLVRAMAARRSHRVSGDDDDIRDPIGRAIEVHQEVADVIADSLVRVLDGLVARRATVAGALGGGRWS